MPVKSIAAKTKLIKIKYFIRLTIEPPKELTKPKCSPFKDLVRTFPTTPSRIGTTIQMIIKARAFPM